MKTKLLIFGIIFLLLIIVFSGCTDNSNSVNDEEKIFVGTWEYAGDKPYSIENVTIILFSDKTFSYQLGASGIWSLKDGKLVLDFQDGLSFVYDYYFSEDNTVLYLKGQLYDDFAPYEKQ